MSENKNKQRSRPSRSSRSIRPRRPSQWGLAASVSVLVTASFLTAIGVWVLLSWAMTGGLPFFAHAQPIDINGADLLRNALFVVGGLGGVVALTVNYRKRRDAELGQFGLDFASAAEQLGGQSAAVRIAGVYAMAALADRSQAHTERQQQCVDALCAYLRLAYQPDPHGALASALHRTTVKLPDGTIREEERTYITQPQEREVRLTIISVIRDHLRPGARSSWSGRNFDFTGAVFDGGDFSKVEFTAGVVSFRDAKFSRDVSFLGAEFSGGKVDFWHAKFSDGYVDFGSAKFSGGIVNFWDAEFSGGTVAFRSAEFSDAHVYFVGAKFSGSRVDFGSAKFSSGIVNFMFAKFSDGHVDFEFAEFSGANVEFRSAEFSGSEVDFAAAKFSNGHVDFGSAKFSGGNINFGGARLPDLFDIDFAAAKFSDGHVDFEFTEFSGANVDFGSAKFSSGIVNFGSAKFSSGIVNFEFAKFSGEVDFVGAWFSGTEVDFKYAKFSGGTVDLSQPASWEVPPQGLPYPPPEGLLLPSP